MLSYAKVNIFLKITGTRENYHELASRFILVKSLYDELSFVQAEASDFSIEGNFDCPLEKNTIYKAYKELEKKVPSIAGFFRTHKVKVEKNIPTHAGLGGGSSNAAVFLLLVNSELGLGLSKDALAKIGVKVGADVPFFIYGYESANVKGIGEVVDRFEEQVPKLEIIKSGVECSTADVFKNFRANFFKLTSNEDAQHLLSQKSIDLLHELTPNDANDLYESALSLCPNLEQMRNQEYFLSGSGGTFFKMGSE